MAQPNLTRFAVASLLPLAILMGCTQNTNTLSQSTPSGLAIASPGKQLKVVTTFLPVYLFTKAVAGDAATVSILIKPGTEVHEYQSTPADVQAIAQADVVVKNGLGIEEFLDNTVQSAENKPLQVIDASKGIASIGQASEVLSVEQSKPADGHAHADSTHDHGRQNPHVWLDPVQAKQQVANIRDGLIAVDAANKDVYTANAKVYIQKLSQLNTQFNQELKPYQDRTFVTFHDAFPYLAKRYRLKQVAVVAIPEDQLSPADVQNTISTVRQFRVKALFSEPGIDNKLLTSLSQDLGIKVYPLDSLESGDINPQYYFTVMQKNLQTLKTAFK